MNGVELQEEIVKWLERRREKFLSAAQTANIPPSIQSKRSVVTDISETGYQSHEEPHENTPLTVPGFAVWICEQMVPTEIGRAHV